MQKLQLASMNGKLAVGQVCCVHCQHAMVWMQLPWKPAVVLREQIGHFFTVGLELIATYEGASPCTLGVMVILKGSVACRGF